MDWKNYRPIWDGEEQFVPDSHCTKPNSIVRTTCIKCKEIKEVSCYIRKGFPIPEAPLYTCPLCMAEDTSMDHLDHAPGRLADHLRALPQRLEVIKDASKRWIKTHDKAPRQTETATALKRRAMRYRASLYGLPFDFDAWKQVIAARPKCLCGTELNMDNARCAYRDNYRPGCRFCVKTKKMPND